MYATISRDSPCPSSFPGFSGALKGKEQSASHKQSYKVPLCYILSPCPQAKEMLDLTAPVQRPHITNSLNHIFKRIMENEEVTQYSLRYTFATVCQQYVRPDIVDIWMGDSPERLIGKVYTHFPDEFMREQMNAVIFTVQKAILFPNLFPKR